MNKIKREADRRKDKASKHSLRQNQSAKEIEVTTEETKTQVQSLCHNLSTEENVLASEDLSRQMDNLRQNKSATEREVVNDKDKTRKQSLCQEETKAQTTKRKRSGRLQTSQSRSKPDNKPTDMEKAIADAVKDSLKILHCTKREGKEDKGKPSNMAWHGVYFCIVCDVVIKDIE